MSFFDGSNANPAARRLARWLTGAVVLVLAGCGEPNPLKGAKLYPVKGKVLLADGKPLTSGHVVFVRTDSAISSTATIESDGGFAFKGSTGDGLPEGEYKVRIEAGSPDVVKGSGGRSKTSLPFATKYLDEDSSILKATVTTDEGKNNFDFKLEAKNSTSSTPSHGGR
jgi:hypothetical protein